jgi:hypothetical protein
MSKYLGLFCSFLLVFQTCLPSAALGQQETATISAPLVLEDGTPVKLRISQTVSSADAHVNDKVEFEVLEDVKVGEILVIPKGGIAWGTVTEAQPKRRMARGGKLEIVMDSVRLVDAQKAALRATKEGKGGGHTGGMAIGIVAAAIVFWPAAPLFLLMHGKDITFPKGTEVPTFINGNMTLDQAKFRQSLEGSTQPQPQVTTALTTVTISSMPAGAEIYIDENFVGNTPSTVNVPTGKHSITVKKQGFQNWARAVATSGGAITLTAELVGGTIVPVTASERKSPASSEVAPNSFVEERPALQGQDASPVVEGTTPGWIGISTKHTAGGGALVTAVMPDGPAAKAGLKVGDVINELDGTPVINQDFKTEIAKYKAGTKISIGYVRDEWGVKTTVTVGTRPS